MNDLDKLELEVLMPAIQGLVDALAEKVKIEKLLAELMNESIGRDEAF